MELRIRFILLYSQIFLLLLSALSHSVIIDNYNGKNSFTTNRSNRCGVRSMQTMTSASSLMRNRIVGGTSAALEAQPWIVALLYKGRFFCGGSLISDRLVVTAAHCVANARLHPTDLEVAYGNTEWTKGRKIGVAKATIHPLFKTTGRPSYDAALLKLAGSTSQDGAIITPVCLPDYPPPVGKECYVAGWGRLGEGKTVSPVLQEVAVPIYNSNICNDANHYNGLVDPSMFCAGYEEGFRDACQGDSGGPLICYCDKRKIWELQGIVSWGAGCARARNPGVFTRVTMVKQWIVQQMNSM
ncbi:transmembrane protease serine 6 [Trichuris trichiura]|uniref:Transmembrane protease serine 6 n=1 Tax=Trichuris trichiura TaxID=36087 RepID=A0A077ZCG3_TRITR|nr:transmembrane protease serine 6 [Trichuris trichiura]